MIIFLSKLRENGVEFDFNKVNDTVTFQRDKWTNQDLRVFDTFVNQFKLDDSDIDELSCFVDRLVVLSAIKKASR